MQLFLESVKDALIELAPEELIGALLIALNLALIPSGIATWRRRKGPDSLAFLSGLMYPGLIAAMVVGIGYGKYARTVRLVGPNDGHYRIRPAGPGSPGPLIPGEHPGMSGGLDFSNRFAVQFFAGADADHDSRLTPDEVAQFFAKPVTSRRGSMATRAPSPPLGDCWLAPREAGPASASDGPPPIRGHGSRECPGMRAADRTAAIE